MMIAAAVPHGIHLMVGTRTNRLIEQLHVALPGAASDDATDAALLERYIATRDSASFATLVARHGPMVWGVCRRALSIQQDAEDAFQATFLVLMRKAAYVSPRQMVGNWLYGVARQTTLKARALAARRGRRECQVCHMPERETLAPEQWPDLCALLDEELARLPRRYRAVILLCDLDGKTRSAAAQQLGVPNGTVAGWLARGRAMLARRLTRRGVSLSAVTLSTTLVQLDPAAKAPAALVSSTIEAAARCAAGTLTTDAVRASVAILSEGVLRSMLLSKLKAALLLVVLAGVIGTGITGLAIQATAGQEAKSPKEPTRSAGKLVAQPADAPADFKLLKQEVERLRSELDALKKQVAATPKPAANDETEPKLTVRVYPVAKLLGEADRGESLMRVITTTVRPQSWQLTNGGTGTIEYFAAGVCLVINQTEDVHAQIEKLLAELLKVKDAQNAARTGTPK